MFYSKSSAFLTSTLLALGITSQAYAQASVGVVDRDKVITSYPKAQQYADELKKAEQSAQTY